MLFFQLTLLPFLSFLPNIQRGRVYPPPSPALKAPPKSCVALKAFREIILEGLGDVWAGLGFAPRTCGRRLGGSWAVLEGSWGDLGASWAALGGSWAGLGRCWRDLGGFLTESWKVLGRKSWGRLGRVFGGFGASWGGPGALQSIRIGNGVGGQLVLEPLGCILGPFSDVFAIICSRNFNKNRILS